MFENVLSKRRYPVVEDGDIRFITGIRGTIARDNSSAEVAIKCCTHNS